MSEKTFCDNVAILSEAIMKAIEFAEPYEWVEWNSFGGRQVYYRQPLRDAQKQSVEKLLKSVFKKDYEQSSLNQS